MDVLARRCRIVDDLISGRAHPRRITAIPLCQAEESLSLHARGDERIGGGRYLRQ